MVEITTEFVKDLIHAQFPQYDSLIIKPIAKNGNDNRTFHLGNEMTVRLPSGEAYAAQIEKELKWLPKLKPHLSLPIPTPITKGTPSVEYPFEWSVNQYIQGETLNSENVTDLNQLAADLAMFLNELQLIDIADAPVAGKHNFYRGGDLGIYNQETEQAFIKLIDILPIDKLTEIWKQALGSHWNRQAVWVHGDIAPGNLLVNNGVLCGIIDFGIMAVGDPACDFVIAWTFFDAESRGVFLKKSNCDDATISRAKGWALWKALITYNDNDPAVALHSRTTLSSILEG